MSLKGRRFSLDNSALVEGYLVGKKGGGRTCGKKSRQSVDAGQMESQELSSSVSLSKETIAEEQSDVLVQKSSLRKHNKTFHKLFPEIPEDETVTHAFSCSLHREVLYHGRLFVSENYLGFYSSVLLKDTKVIIPTVTVRQVKKHYLSMLSVQTADGDKHTFVSLRQREFTFELILSRCLNTQAESTNSSPHLSSAENEPDPEMASGSSSMEEAFGRDGSPQSGDHLGESVPRVSDSADSKEAGAAGLRSDARGSLAEPDGGAAPSWIWGLLVRLSVFLLDLQDLSLFFYLNMLLVVLLLLVSGLIGLQIMALHERLESLGALAELHLRQ